MVKEELYIKTKDNTELFCQIKETGSQVWIVATHGIGEHLGRHSYLAELFGQDFNLFQYDLRGHGKSQGEKGNIDQFETFYSDLKDCVNFLKEKYKMKRFILFGHSMGALITSGFVQSYADADFYPERVILSAPPVGVGGPFGPIVNPLPLPLFEKAGQLPGLKVSGLVALKDLSHDPRIVEDYQNDPLTQTRLNTHLVLEMIKASKTVFSRPLRPRCPAFVCVGDKDNIVSPKCLIKYFGEVEKSFNLRVFEGAYHEMHNEIERYKLPYFDHLKQLMQDSLYT